MALLGRRWAKLADGVEPSLRVAILGSGSAETILPQLRVACAARGHDFTAHLGTFDALAQEALDRNGALYRFRPQITLVQQLPSSLATPPPLATQAEVERLADGEAKRLLYLCGALHEGGAGEVVLCNFEPPWDDPRRGLPSGSASLSSLVAALNARLAKEAPRFVHLLDVAALAAAFGQDRWHDARLWHHAKQPMSPDGAAFFARKFAGIVAALRGTSSKCLVLDLDNTLWGGVVAEEGLEGIRLGEGSAEGEAYRAFQRYLLGLKERGVLLAACSKNDEANARRPFLEHPETILKLDDFCCFVANWESKADNCLRIARELNLLPEALVFLDDEPAEREIVRRYAPQVKVLEAPADPSLFPRAVERSFFFEAVSLTGEDLQRASSYHAESERRKLETSVTNVEEFLRSLEMKAVATPYRAADVARIAQLFSRSNQFNLCTRRFTEQEVQTILEDLSVVSLQVRLRDRLGDYGLIALAHLRPAGKGVLRLENWVMSCRVLKRGVEELTADLLLTAAAQKGAQRVEFDYLPSPKNGLVADLYARLGFEKVADLDGGGQRWTVRVANHRPKPTFISTEAVDPHS